MLMSKRTDIRIALFGRLPAFITTGADLIVRGGRMLLELRPLHSRAGCGFSNTH